MSEEAAAVTTEAPEQAPVEPVQDAAPAEAQPEAPQGGPDLTDAITQLNAAREAFEQQARPSDQDVSLFERLLGSDDDYEEQGYQDPGHQDPYAQQPQPQPEAAGDVEQFRAAVREEIEQTVGPILAQQEVQRREAEILSIAEKYPRIQEPEVTAAVERELEGLAATYGEGIKTDPRAVLNAYFAVEGRLSSQQTSQEPEGAQEAPAEAGGSQGPVVETGAGPGAPPPEMDPVEQAYNQALGGRPPTDPWGFPVQ